MTAVPQYAENARQEQILTWAQTHGEEFRGQAAAEYLGIKVQGIGPVLSAMAKRDLLNVRYEGSKRFYKAPEVEMSETPEQPASDIEAMRSDFIPKLVAEMRERDDTITANVAELDQTMEEMKGKRSALVEEQRGIRTALKAFKQH